MNTETDNQIITEPANVIASDQEARFVLEQAESGDEVASTLLSLALKTSFEYSFVDNQTYPRANHPSAQKRLSPLFTFTAIITSLRCTLEIEQKVTEHLINFTSGEDDNLLNTQINELESILRPSGLALQKSIWITNGLRFLSDASLNNLNTIKNSDINEARLMMLSMQGIGPKAADCFLLLGLDRAVFPVDVNVFNVVSGLFPKLITGNPSITPKFSNYKHVSTVKLLLETTFTKNVKLYQILHTYLLLAGKYKISL